MQKVRDIVEKGHSIRKENGLSVKQPLASYSSKMGSVGKSLEYLVKDEINVKKIIWNAKIDKFDTKMTEELKEEAYVRDLVRMIQGERKKLGLDLTQKVNVRVEKIPIDTHTVQWMIRKAQIKNISVGGFKVTKA